MCGLLSYSQSRLKEPQPRSSQWCDPKRYGESVDTVKLASSELKVSSDFVLSWCHVHFLQISGNNAMFLRLLFLAGFKLQFDFMDLITIVWPSG